MHTNATALVLDGVNDDAQRVASLLQALGFEILVVTPSGTEAVAHCRHVTPDLLVVGNDLHGLIGPEVVLRMIEEFARIPVVRLADLTAPKESSLPRKSSRADLAQCIAHAFGVVSWHAASGPPQDYILDDRILLRHNERMIRVAIDDILYVSDQCNYSSLELADGSYFISIPIQLVEHRLAPHGFLRVHRDYLVNYRHVREVHDDLWVLERVKMPVGRAYRRSVSRRIRQLI
ncbi:LytR/AlgR family response regulator transcription factor [Neolewinella litorea]|uniref:HTH LytTR-type domain-containing protein n=1 Tax=Neolewinella litorea TaxID=2562452 RepID=A0A4S4NLA2_9BACT|nr:response regulator transcription factor [Neolewinella litorea]THH40674.1 hypothetical protein E4021_08065 [Neolewinella litorea]